MSIRHGSLLGIPSTQTLKFDNAPHTCQAVIFLDNGGTFSRNCGILQSLDNFL